MIPRSTSLKEGEPPPDPSPTQRIHFDPYDAPKSFHASRAFAEMQERAELRARSKRTRFSVALSIGLVVLLVIAASRLLYGWF